MRRWARPGQSGIGRCVRVGGWNWFSLYGQSNCLGHSWFRPLAPYPALLSTVPSPIHLTYSHNRAQYDFSSDAGVNGYGSAESYGAVKPLEEVACTVAPYNGRLGESPMSGAAEMISDLLAAENGAEAAARVRMLMNISGEGDRTIAQLGRGTVPWGRLVAAGRWARTHAAAAGETLGVGAFAFIHGENDAWGLTARATYANRMSQVQADFATDVAALGIQAVPPYMLAPQLAAHSVYRAYTAGVPTIALAQVDASDTNQKIRMVFPMYVFDFSQISRDDPHLSTPDNKWAGAYLGLAWKRTVYDGRPYRALRILSARRDGRRVRVATNARSRMVLDTSWVTEAPAYGFVLVDSGGAPLSISSVQVSGDREVTVMAAADLPAGARLRYAWGSPSDGIGRVLGPRGNLRDSQGDGIKFDLRDGTATSIRRMDNYALIAEVSVQ